MTTPNTKIIIVNQEFPPNVLLAMQSLAHDSSFTVHDSAGRQIVLERFLYPNSSELLILSALEILFSNHYQVRLNDKLLEKHEIYSLTQTTEIRSISLGVKKPETVHEDSICAKIWTIFTCCCCCRHDKSRRVKLHAEAKFEDIQVELPDGPIVGKFK